MSKRLQINETLGDYRITGFLGEGGMGVVYRGVHEKLGRPTAIKVLGATSSGDPTFKSRFMNEARLQAGLHHRNVATLYDFRQHGEELVIFMELVDGDCLEDLVNRRAFTVDEALTVFASICEAITYIHDHGIVHRDIKAQNAKLTASGVVKMLDFGISKDMSSHGLTQSGGIIGTPNYLSPEQLQGSPASYQTDIWALGVLLYEMLTGQLPFCGETLGSLVMAITKGEFPSVNSLNPAVPPQVASIIAKCLKKDLRSRYSSAHDLLKDVRRVLDARRVRIEANDLRTAVSRARERPAERHRPSIDTSPSGLLRTAVTSRTRARNIIIACGAGGGALLLIVTIVALYFFMGPGDTSAQSGETNCPSDRQSDTLRCVRIELDEGKAEVFRDGRLLGSTPLRLELKTGETVRLRLRREGFEEKDVKITAAKTYWRFELTRKE